MVGCLVPCACLLCGLGGSSAHFVSIHVLPCERMSKESSVKCTGRKMTVPTSLLSLNAILVVVRFLGAHTKGLVGGLISIHQLYIMTLSLYEEHVLVC